MDYYPLMFEIKRADISAQSDYFRKEKTDALRKYEFGWRHIKDAGQCVGLKDLAVSGKDLMELGMKQGASIGQALNELLEYVIENPEANTKEALLEYLRKR